MADYFDQFRDKPTGPTLAPPKSVEESVSSKTPQGWFQQFSPEQHPENAPYVGRLAAESLPMAGSFLPFRLGTPLGTTLKLAVKGIAPQFFGDAPSTVEDAAVEYGKDYLFNRTIPNIVSKVAGGTANAARAFKEGTFPAYVAGQFSSAPGVRGKVAQLISQETLSQHARPLSQTVEEAAARAGTSAGIHDQIVQTAMRDEPIQLLQEPAKPEMLPPLKPVRPADVKFSDPEFPPKPQLAAFPPAPKLEDFPVERTGTIGQVGQRQKFEEAAEKWKAGVEKSKKDYKDALVAHKETSQALVEARKAEVAQTNAANAESHGRNLSQWRLDTKELEDFTNRTFSAQQEAYKVQQQGLKQGTLLGPETEKALAKYHETFGPGTIGEKLLKMDKEIRAGEFTPRSETFQSVADWVMKDPNTVQALKATAGVGGEKLARDFAFHKLLTDETGNEVLNVKSILKKLDSEGTRETYQAAIRPETQADFRNLLAEIQKQEKGGGFANALVHYADHKLYWTSVGLGVLTHPALAVKGAAGAITVKLTNNMLTKVMENPETAQLVLQAMRTPRDSAMSPLLNQALRATLQGAETLYSVPPK